ncbi:MAG: CAP domain-containing protein [Rivularia sp. (in: cyanobacteria)]
MPINLFDANFYRSANSDLNGLSDKQAWSHFKNYGLENGLKFSPLVDLDFYRSSNSDLADLNNRQAYEHLVNYGVSQGRQFSSLVDLEFYRESNIDLANFNNEELFSHLKDSGMDEGRSSSPLFDVKTYLASNPDVAQVFGSNYREAFNYFVIEGLSNELAASEYIESDSAGNTLDTARTIALDSGEIIFRDSVGNDSDDFYSLNLTNSNNNLELGISGLNADADLELLGGSGEIIARAANPGNIDESLSVSNLEAGAYYVRIMQVNEAPDTNYNLSLSVMPIEDESKTIVLNESTPVPATPISATPQSASTSVSSNPLIDQVVRLTNSYRGEYGLQPLTLNSNLSNSAQTHSQDMALNDFFSHTGSDNSKVSDRTQLAGYESYFVGENIAAGYITPEEVVRGWINSPGHRENILNPNYLEMGVGYHYLENDTGEVNYNTYWTQDFGAVVSG